MSPALNAGVTLAAVAKDILEVDYNIGAYERP